MFCAYVLIDYVDGMFVGLNSVGLLDRLIWGLLCWLPLVCEFFLIGYIGSLFVWVCFVFVTALVLCIGPKGFSPVGNFLVFSWLNVHAFKLCCGLTGLCLCFESVGSVLVPYTCRVVLG